MVNVILKKCVQKYDEKIKTIVIYPTDSDYKIKLEKDGDFSFDIRTKNDIKIKHDSGITQSGIFKESEKVNANKNITIVNNSKEQTKKISKIYISNVKDNNVINEETINLNNFDDYFDIYNINVNSNHKTDIKKQSNNTSLNNFKQFIPSNPQLTDKKRILIELLKRLNKNNKKKYLIVVENNIAFEDNIGVKNKIIKTLNHIEKYLISFNLIYLSMDVDKKFNYETNLLTVNNNFTKIIGNDNYIGYGTIFNSKTLSSIINSLENSLNDPNDFYKNISDRYVFNPMLSYSINNEPLKIFDNKNIIKCSNPINKSYKIYIKGILQNQQDINLYNVLKNKYHIVEVYGIKPNKYFTYIIFGSNVQIESGIKYILVDNTIDEQLISKSKYTIVNAINIINKYIANYPVYKRLLLNNSEENLKLLLSSLKITLPEENIISVSEDKINVLTISTSLSRIDNFKKANKNFINNFNIINGIKCVPGFIGCGLSYKMIVSNASRLNLNYVKICEDDCKINNHGIIQKSIDYLRNNNLEWELLSCFIVDVDDDFKIYERIELDNNYKLLKINKWTSMVCNVYSKDSYGFFKNYHVNENELNEKNIFSNTIDRKLDFENVWVIYPFPVELLNSKSEIWDNNNNYLEYDKLLKKSCKIIENNIKTFDVNRTKINLYENLLNYQDILNQQFDILSLATTQPSSSTSNIIFSLTSIPPRFITDTFKTVIDKLSNQILKPKYIVINLCYKYKRNFDYDVELFNQTINYFNSNYSNVIINYSEDYGPATKLIGILYLNETISNTLTDEDKIIIVDDDWFFSDKISIIYELCYQLYNCDCVFVDERKNIEWNANYHSYMKLIKPLNIFYNNYQNFAYGWLSFSFKYKCIKKILNFYNEITKLDDLLWKHDDLIFTIFYKTNKFNACGINMLMFENINRSPLDDYCALKDDSNAWMMRFELEKKILNYYGIEIEILNRHNYVKNNINNLQNYVIQSNIEKRFLLFGVENIEYDPENNFYTNKHLDFKYLNNNVMIVTLTTYNDKTINNFEITYMIDAQAQKNNLCPNNYSSRQSFFIKTNKKITKSINVCNYDFKIIQTSETSNISSNRFNTILTILSNLPYLKYKFYDNVSREAYIANNKNKLMYIYKKINVGAYQADFFRALYVYLEGGIYFDCKNTLYCDLNEYLINDCFFIKDGIPSYVCNGIFFSKKNNLMIKNYLVEIISNVINENYTNDSLSITGPGLMGKHITNNILFYYYMKNDDWQNNVIKKKDDSKLIIKTSYNGYYDENNYLNTSHYSVLWKEHRVFVNTSNMIDYSKINFINCIGWINLDRSTERRTNMESILSNINVPNIRISAIDGKTENVREYINVDTKMSNYEIACSLSHLKAIMHLSKMDGEYFMICEDDINFNYINLFEETLKDIILNSPPFDLLLINKIYDKKIIDNYIQWNEEAKKGHDYHIAGAGCYIVSREGINNVLKLFSYDSLNNIFNFKNNNFNVSDVFLYMNTNTFVYKYNFVNINCFDSEIHPEHIEWHITSRNAQIKDILNKIFD